MMPRLTMLQMLSVAMFGCTLMYVCTTLITIIMLNQIRNAFINVNGDGQWQHEFI